MKALLLLSNGDVQTCMTGPHQEIQVRVNKNGVSILGKFLLDPYKSTEIGMLVYMERT